jgi:dephospho-CoA kinase
MTKIVGLTGGIGSGKSTIAKVFEKFGVPIYEADVRAKFLIENEAEIKGQIIELLGVESYDVEGKYNRAYVSKEVFSDKDLLLKLNEIVHPWVKKDFGTFIFKHKNSPFLIKEAAIMEASSELNFILVVHSDQQTRIKRILKRDANRDIEEIKKIINSQKTEEEFIKMADFKIYNNEETLVLPQIIEIFEKLQQV